MAKVFVTGGSGFVGRNLIRRLRERGDEVVAAARSAQAVDTVRALGAEPVPADLADARVLAEGMAGCSLAIHAAAKVEQWGPLADFHRVNVEGTEHVIAAARAAGVRRLVHVGTEAVLVGGRPIIDADETWPIPERPGPGYSATKALAEQRVLAANSTELTTVVVRPRFIWGRDDTSLLPQFMAAVKAGTYAWIGGGRYLTSTCHVANVVEGALLAAERGRPGGVYFLTDGPPIEFREFITRLLRTQGVEPQSRSLPRGVAAVLGAVLEALWPRGSAKPPPLTRTALHVMGEQVTVSDARARRELGYREVITREQGFAELEAGARTASRTAG